VTPYKNGFRDDEYESKRLEGRNVILEALKNGAPLDKIFIKKGEIEGTLRIIKAMARDIGVPVCETDKVKLDFMSRAGSHQGVIATLSSREYVETEDILAAAEEKGEQPFILALDGMTDPRNFGAIIRSADAFGVHGVITTKRRSAGLTAAASKAAAGAAEYALVARAPNLAGEIDKLKKRGLWVAYADARGEPISAARLDGPLAVVIGGEGGGVSALTRKKCDFNVSIPMLGHIPSLNASVAAAIIMYEVSRRRRGE
jgi:23S rRNA (guanosine2251-2'-O)-methyltransferase